MIKFVIKIVKETNKKKLGYQLYFANCILYLCQCILTGPLQHTHIYIGADSGDRQACARSGRPGGERCGARTTTGHGDGRGGATCTGAGDLQVCAQSGNSILVR